MATNQPLKNLSTSRQGDVVMLDWIPAVGDNEPSKLETPLGVVILSQTCDVVRDPSARPNILVAPVVADLNHQQMVDARRGRAPLLLHLASPTEGGGDKFANLQYATAVPKNSLVGTTLLSRHTTADSAADAAHLGARIGRTFSRFAFPDEIHGITDALAKKARETHGTAKPFGRVIDYVIDLRIKANHWDQPARVLNFYIIVDKKMLISPSEVDPNWIWSDAELIGAKPGTNLEKASLVQVSEALANACDAYQSSPFETNLTTLFKLWTLWAAKTKEDLLDRHLGPEIAQVHVTLESDDEFSLAQMRRTTSLDLEDLSDSHGAC